MKETTKAKLEIINKQLLKDEEAIDKSDPRLKPCKYCGAMTLFEMKFDIDVPGIPLCPRKKCNMKFYINVFDR